jgi:hypothetical protein
METEAVPVEEQISKLEAEIKLYRNAAFPQSKALVASFEAEVKMLKEQQKLARPLPARFQAATDKLVKFKLLKDELATKAQLLQEQAAAAAKAFQEKAEAVKKEAADCEAKLAEAEVELATVKTDLAAEQPVLGAAPPAAVGPASPEMVARICDLLAQRVQGVQLNPEFLVELALVMDPRAAAAMKAAPVAAAAAAAAGALAPVSQAGVWAACQAEALATANGAWEVFRARLQQAGGQAAAQAAALAAAPAVAQAPTHASPAAAGTTAAPQQGLQDGQMQSKDVSETFGAAANKPLSERSGPYNQLLLGAA